jgi:membrane-associated phospholipid phosphatase
MTPSQIIGGFLLGIITIAALSIILAPNSTTASVLKALIESTSGLVKAAKA